MSIPSGPANLPPGKLRRIFKTSSSATCRKHPTCSRLRGSSGTWVGSPSGAWSCRQTWDKVDLANQSAFAAGVLCLTLPSRNVAKRAGSLCLVHCSDLRAHLKYPEGRHTVEVMIYQRNDSRSDFRNSLSTSCRRFFKNYLVRGLDEFRYCSNALLSLFLHLHKSLAIRQSGVHNFFECHGRPGWFPWPVQRTIKS